MVKPLGGRVYWEGLTSLGFCAKEGLCGSGLFLFFSSFPVLTTTCQVLPWCSSPQPWNQETIRPWTGDSKNYEPKVTFFLWVYYQLFQCSSQEQATPPRPPPKMVLCILALELLSLLTWDISYVSVSIPTYVWLYCMTWESPLLLFQFLSLFFSL